MVSLFKKHVPSQVQLSISKEKIETSSKGPDEPIADNKTAEGKAKNRRTSLKVIKE